MLTKTMEIVFTVYSHVGFREYVESKDLILVMLNTLSKILLPNLILLSNKHVFTNRVETVLILIRWLR